MEPFLGMNPIFLFLAITGISFVFLGAILRKYPPKRINHLYGYRTKSSMGSQDRWDHAQAYSASEMIKQGTILGVLGLLLAITTDMDEISSVVIFVLLLSTCCVALFLRTERSLKDTFK